MYSIKKSHMAMQIMVGILLLAGSIILKNWGFIIFFFLVLLIFIRDVYRQTNITYEIDEKSIRELYNGKVKIEITWNKVDFVTRTRKNKKWIVVGNVSDIITLKNSIENYEELKKEVIDRASKRKKTYIHETLI